MFKSDTCRIGNVDQLWKLSRLLAAQVTDSAGNEQKEDQPGRPTHVTNWQPTRSDHDGG
jgi:hypothetical protein